MLAASPSADEHQVKDFLSALGEYTTEFDSKEKRENENIAYVAKTFGQQESDVKEWLSTVAWYHDLAKVESKVVLDTLQYVNGHSPKLFHTDRISTFRTLEKAGVVKQPEGGWNVSDFVNEKVATIV